MRSPSSRAEAWLFKTRKNYVVRAQATSSSTAAASSGDGLPDAERLRAEAALRGSDWLRAELDGSMAAERLRSFGAGLGVQKRDPASGQQRTKGQLLDALVNLLCPPSSAEAWFSTALVSWLSSFGTLNAQLVHDKP